jgi:hypothetical protein
MGVLGFSAHRRRAGWDLGSRGVQNGRRFAGFLPQRRPSTEARSLLLGTARGHPSRRSVLATGRPSATAPEAPIELYDLKTDLAESKDLATEKPDLVAKAESLMKSMRADHPDWPLVMKQSGKKNATKKKQ